MADAKHTPGDWDFACDSYGKVRHSKKACVFTNVKSPEGDRLVTVAARIQNWDDARLIAAAPDLLSALIGLLPQTFTGAPDRIDEIAHWERERALGNGQAPLVLAAFAAIARATVTP